MDVPFYLNKSLKNLRGEKWKAIPGFEGLYEASNMGRVKSLNRMVLHPRFGEQYVEGRILSHSISKNANTVTGIPMIDLRISLNRDGISHYFNTRRIIYLTFVNPGIDYAKDGLYVINKDGDGYNNKVSNLKLVSKEEKQQRVYKRNRAAESYLKTADRSLWTKPYGGIVNRKAIKQFNLKGKLIASYKSVTEAAKATATGEKEIINVAKGRYSQWNGYVWKYANPKA